MLEPLYRPCRYKVLYGGRGGGKSWGIARTLLILGAQSKLRILCAREFQSSIADSVHKLLSDQIIDMGMEAFYTVEKATIYGINGTEFRFAGIRTNISAIKSFEGIDIAWLEEAANVSKHSWMTLIPTIRKEGSEIWISFNPELEADETYQRFVVSPPSEAVVLKINWDDNPFFPDTLRAEMEALRERNYDDYLHVYGGNCKHALEGAVFAKEIRDATNGNRICNVPWVQNKPVDVFFDLGRRDLCSVFFAQIVGFEYRILDFYEANGFGWSHYLKVLQEKSYVYGDVWLPHDAEHELLASERTITQQTRAAGYRVRIVPKISKASQIEAARNIFNQCWFDRERTSDALQHLRHYQYDVDPETKLRGKEPMHDEHSHCADAFMYLAVAMREPKKTTVLPKFVKPSMPIVSSRPGAWLGRM